MFPTAAAVPPEPRLPWAEPLAARLRRWGAEGPESWMALPPEVQAELQAHRVQRSTFRPSTRRAGVGGGGVLGHLARHLYPDRVSPEGKVRYLNAWALLGSNVPTSVLNHESLPGVADGWLVLAQLYLHWVQHPQRKDEDRAAKAALDQWSKRLVGHHPPVEWPRLWRLGLFETLVALQKNNDAPPLMVWRLLSALLAPRERAWPRWGAALRVRQELAMLALATPGLRQELAAHAMDLHAALDGRIHLTSPADLQAAAVWEGILEVYQVHRHREKRREKTRGAQGNEGDSRFLEGTMCAWMDAGFVPTRLKGAAIRSALVELEQRAPDLYRRIVACRLDSALPPPGNTASRTRPRL